MPRLFNLGGRPVVGLKSGNTMRLHLVLCALGMSAASFGVAVSTTDTARDLDRSAKACLQHFAPGGSGTQEGFEACLKQSLDQYYRSLVAKAWGTPKSSLVVDTSTPTPVPTPPIDRAKESARAKEEFKRMVRSTKCQRCHAGMDPSQFTLQQMHSVLNTPTHREHLGPAETEYLKNLGNLIQ